METSLRRVELLESNHPLRKPLTFRRMCNVFLCTNTVWQREMMMMMMMMMKLNLNLNLIFPVIDKSVGDKLIKDLLETRATPVSHKLRLSHTTLEEIRS